MPDLVKGGNMLGQLCALLSNFTQVVLPSVRSVLDELLERLADFGHERVRHNIMLLGPFLHSHQQSLPRGEAKRRKGQGSCYDRGTGFPRQASCMLTPQAA